MERIMEPANGEITLLLAKWRDGESSAFEQLSIRIYTKLLPRTSIAREILKISRPPRWWMKYVCA
jgi:hypothetical protein